MTVANTAQFESWNGESGTRWVARAEERDLVLAPVADALLAAADPSPGQRVLDVGSGCGATTLAAAALIGRTGHATGLDLSGPMLEVARGRARASDATNATFTQGDAQSHAYDEASFDLVISRFGTMFFADAVAAFTNLRSALRPGGRLTIATWQPLTDNDWLMVPAAALLDHTTAPATSTDGPGMFAQSDPELVHATLAAAGLSDIVVTAVEVTFTLGPTLDAAVDYLADTGPGRLLLDTIPEGPAREAALSDVRASLVDHTKDGHVVLAGGIWITTATVPG